MHHMVVAPSWVVLVGAILILILVMGVIHRARLLTICAIFIIMSSVFPGVFKRGAVTLFERFRPPSV